jgi:DNA ligase D-like protein (predicted polymerase)
MQKNRPDHYPAEIGVWEVPKRDGDLTQYPVITEPTAIPYLANQGTITFHAWTSRVDQPGTPDWLVMDLDPFEGDTGKVREAAYATRDVFDAYGLKSLPVATGSKRFHVWVRLQPDLAYGIVGRAAHALASFIQLAAPEAATGEFLKCERDGKVFVDWLRNSHYATVASPLSLRPRPNASVAMPITWEELATTNPDDWTLGTTLERLPDIPAFPEAWILPVDAIESAAIDLGVDLDTSFDRFGREQ